MSKHKRSSNLRSTFKNADVLKSLASHVYVLASSSVQPWMMSFLTLPSAMMSYFLVLWISCPFLNHCTSAFSLDTSHSSTAVASSSTVWSSRGLVNSTGDSAWLKNPIRKHFAARWQKKISQMKRLPFTVKLACVLKSFAVRLTSPASCNCTSLRVIVWTLPSARVTIYRTIGVFQSVFYMCDANKQPTFAIFKMVFLICI